MVRLLERRPQWRAELRRLILTEDLLGLPGLVRDLARDVPFLRDDVASVKRDVSALRDDVAALKGSDLERTYRDRAAQYFQAIVRRIRIVDHQQLADILDDALDAARISLEDKEQALKCDLVLVGRRDGEQVYLVAEVSSVVDRGDVARARQRAEIVERATGRPAIPAAAGPEATPGAREEARASGVWLVLNGKAEPPS